MRFLAMALSSAALAACGSLDESDFADADVGDDVGEIESEARIDYRYECHQFRTLYWGGLETFDVRITARKLTIPNWQISEETPVRVAEGKYVAGYRGTGSRAGKDRYEIAFRENGQLVPVRGGSLTAYGDKKLRAGGQTMRNGRKGGFLQLEQVLDTYSKAEYVCYRR